MEATEKSAISDAIRLTRPETVAGFFATQAGKMFSITDGEPFPDWVTLTLTELEGPALNDQIFYVPKEIFDAAISNYRKPADRKRKA